MTPEQQRIALAEWAGSGCPECAAKSSAAAICSACACGCEHFVWLIDSQQRYSSPTEAQYYDPDRHREARCMECNRIWPNH